MGPEGVRTFYAAIRNAALSLDRQRIRDRLVQARGRALGPRLIPSFRVEGSTRFGEVSGMDPLVGDRREVAEPMVEVAFVLQGGGLQPRAACRIPLGGNRPGDPVEDQDRRLRPRCP